jgi:hypothetical protein
MDYFRFGFPGAYIFLAFFSFLISFSEFAIRAGNTASEEGIMRNVLNFLFMTKRYMPANKLIRHKVIVTKISILSSFSFLSRASLLNLLGILSAIKSGGIIFFAPNVHILSQSGNKSDLSDHPMGAAL